MVAVSDGTDQQVTHRAGSGVMSTGNAIETTRFGVRLQPRMRSMMFLSGLALLSFVGTRAALSGPRQELKPAENIPVASLPFEYFRQHIFVTVQINDSGPHVCMVDNGFNFDAMTEHAASAMGIQSRAAGGETPDAKGLGEGFGPRIFVTESTVVIGVVGSPLLTGHTMVLDTAQIEKLLSHSFDCVIGAPLFALFVVEIDFTKHQLTLYDRHTFVYHGSGHSVPLKVGVPATVEAEAFTADGRRVKATVGLDLGSDQAFEFAPSFQSKHRVLQAQQPKVPISAMGLAGEFQESMVRLPSADFAGFKIEKPLAVFLDTAPDPGLASRKDDGFVGNALLERFNLIFDYSGHRLMLEPNASFSDPFTANMTGIGADPSSDAARGFEVISVADKSVAAIAGLKAGDRITEINGTLCSTLTFESFHQMLTAEGAPFSLKVERADQKIDINFQTPRLP